MGCAVGANRWILVDLSLFKISVSVNRVSVCLSVYVSPRAFVLKKTRRKIRENKMTCNINLIYFPLSKS